MEHLSEIAVAVIAVYGILFVLVRGFVTWPKHWISYVVMCLVLSAYGNHEFLKHRKDEAPLMKRGPNSEARQHAGSADSQGNQLVPHIRTK